MTRLNRSDSLGLANHIVDRAVGNLECFSDFEDHSVFIELIKEKLPDLGVDLYNFALLPNHFHLAVSEPRNQEGFSNGMKQVLYDYSRYHKNKYDRKGILWQPRFKSYPVNNDRYLLTLAAYVDLNPCRAGLTGGRYESAWSSASHYLSGQQNPLLVDNPVILALSEDEGERRVLYRQLLDMWSQRTTDKNNVRKFFMRQPTTFHPDKEVAKKCQTLLVSDTLGV